MIAQGFYIITPLGPRSRQLVYAKVEGKTLEITNQGGQAVCDTTMFTWHRMRPQFIHVDGGWAEACTKFRNLPREDMP